MNFGKVEDPESVDFSLPPTHKGTITILKRYKKASFKNVRVGCAKWNKKDLKGFYPRGTADELEYYSSQFNSVELNASFYRMFPEEQFKTWNKKSARNFQFFPKVPRYISHNKRLKDSNRLVDDFVTNIQPLKKKLGMVFLQMPDNFHPKHLDRLDPFFAYWPKEVALAVEFRHTDWYNDETISKKLYKILEKYKIANVITDTAGRRDLLHMRLTNNTAFIRYVGANHSSDYTRLDEWIDRIEEWHKIGIKNLYFFMHQNVEKESPKLAAYFIERFNTRFNTEIKVPHIPKK